MKRIKSKRGSELLGQILLWALLIGALLVFSVPFFFMISNSFEEFSYVLPYPPRLLPTRLDFSAYKHILELVYVATNVCGHTFFLRNFFRSLPDSLSESVIIDGGGHGTIFFKIMLPLSKPAIGTMTIFAFQGFWEEYFTAKVLVGADEKMMTLPLLLQRLNGQYATRWEWVFAASILALLPVVALFILFQRKMVVGGLTQGAVKG